MKNSRHAQSYILCCLSLATTACGTDLCYYGGMYYDDAQGGPSCAEFTRVNDCIAEHLPAEYSRAWETFQFASWQLAFRQDKLRDSTGQRTNGHYDSTTIYIPDTERWVYSYTHEIGHLVMFYAGQGADVAHADKTKWPLWDHELAGECK